MPPRYLICYRYPTETNVEYYVTDAQSARAALHQFHTHYPSAQLDTIYQLSPLPDHDKTDAYH